MFIVPIIYFANAYFISRLLKRIKPGSDGFLNFIVGFFGVFLVLYLVNVLLYSVNAQVWGYALAYGIFQIMLIGAYIFNWRYLIYKPRFRLRKLIMFLVITILVIGISLVAFRELGSMFGLYWKPTIQNITPSMGNVISFDSKNILVNFSVLNISNVFWANIFKVSQTAQILKFAVVSWTIMAGVICGSIGAWIVDETKSVGRMFLLGIVIILTIVVTLAFIETFAIPDAWLMIELLVYILIMVSCKNGGKDKLIYLTILLMAIIATTSNAYFFAIALFIFTVYWAVRNNANSISYILFLGWAFINAIAGFISIGARYFLISLQMIYTIFVIILIIIANRIGTPVWQVKVARGISKQSTKIVYIALAIFIAAILIANLFIFYEKYNFNFKKIDYRNFLTFIYRIIWNIRIDNDMSIAIINAILYTLFVSLIIAFLVLRKSKNSKGYWFTKDVPVKLGVVAAILFCNPLTVHIFNVATGDYSLNTTNMNMLLFVPFMVYIMQIIFNYKKYPVNKWKYFWI